MQPIIQREVYREKLLGCWLGKNIGGTLGMPFEWKRQVNDVTFYTQDLTGEPVANDDLDIQLLWLLVLEDRGVDIDTKVLAEYWQLYLTPTWAEYGISKSNLRMGLPPPLSGLHNNNFKHSCGAFIRSEIWACIAPGNPRLAASFAYQDAIIDHGDGEGLYAAVFCAALESAAFVEDDYSKLVEIGLSFIPPDCGVAQAVNSVREAVAAGKKWREIRDIILRDFGGHAHTGQDFCISEEDVNKGLTGGDMGYDAPSNIAIVVLGLLSGDDFDTKLCTAVNCGEDTDCTAATIGAVFGIVHGAESIPRRWIDPIGCGIKTMCLELGALQARLPKDVQELTDRVERMAWEVAIRHGGRKNDLQPLSLPVAAQRHGRGAEDQLYRSLGQVLYDFNFFSCQVDYGDEGASIRSSSEKQIRIKICSKGRPQTMVNFAVHAPPAWEIRPGRCGTVPCFSGITERAPVLQFSVKAETLEQQAIRLIVELSVPGSSEIMLLPLILLNGDFLQV